MPAAMHLLHTQPALLAAALPLNLHVEDAMALANVRPAEAAAKCMTEPTLKSGVVIV